MYRCSSIDDVEQHQIKRRPNQRMQRSVVVVDGGSGNSDGCSQSFKRTIEHIYKITAIVEVGDRGRMMILKDDLI